jgi:hypothetical protein
VSVSRWYVVAAISAMSAVRAAPNVNGAGLTDQTGPSERGERASVTDAAGGTTNKAIEEDVQTLLAEMQASFKMFSESVFAKSAFSIRAFDMRRRVSSRFLAEHMRCAHPYMKVEYIH